MPEFKILGKYDTAGVQVKDPGLVRYINTAPLYLPHTGGRHTKKQFWKTEKVTIVERFINHIMRSGSGGRKIGGHVIRDGHATGKKMKAIKIFEKAMDIVEKRTGKNPIQVLVTAIENCAPREETTRISYGGIVYHQSVDCAPQRRVDIALRNITLGAFSASYKNKRSIEECLADEIITAYNYDMKSFAISRKEEIERIARSSR